ncbi:MAG: hypothetical protein ACI8QZ_000966 [Chlamydiales bacterium]|jgi:hypothetical protein
MLKGSPAVMVLPFLAACVIDDGAQPRVDIDIQAASAEVHRGMVQTENGVLAPATILSLPAKEEGTLVIMTQGSLELSDDTGDAWRPDGHSGRLARFDWSVLYEQRLEDVLLTFGLVSYNLPNGLEFPFGERGSTTELLFEAGVDVWGVQPAVRFNYDVDEVEGLYLQLAVAKGVQLAQDWHLALDLGLGWMDQEQAWWNYAQMPDASGLADLRATAELSYTVDQHTSAGLELGLSEVIDSDFRDWFDLLGVDPSQVWVGLGVHWSY